MDRYHATFVYISVHPIVVHDAGRRSWFTYLGHATGNLWSRQSTNSRRKTLGWVRACNRMFYYLVTLMYYYYYYNRAWTANTSFGTPLQAAEPMIVDLGSVTIMVPNRIIDTPSECPEVSSDSSRASNYSLTGSSSGRLVPFATETCFENPTSFQQPVTNFSCYMDIAFADREFGGIMVSDIMSAGGQNVSVNFGMPVQAFTCGKAGERILGMNQGKSSFISQMYRNGYIDEKIVGFCGSRDIPGAFMQLGSDMLSRMDTSSFSLYDGTGLAALTDGYKNDTTFAERAKNISTSAVEKEHYYAVLDSVQIGNDTFGGEQGQYIAMIDSGWTNLGLPLPMIQSITSYINQSLIDNGMDDDVDFLVSLEQPFPQGCIRYNATQYPDPVKLANLVYPTIGISMGENGAYMPINLTETAAFYGQSGGLDQICANVELVDGQNIMLGTPFFLDRYVQLNIDQGMGYFSNVTDCSDISTTLSRIPENTSSPPPENTSCAIPTTTVSLLLLLLVSFYMV